MATCKNHNRRHKRCRNFFHGVFISCSSDGDNAKGHQMGLNLSYLDSRRTKVKAASPLPQQHVAGLAGPASNCLRRSAPSRSMLDLEPDLLLGNPNDGQTRPDDR